MRHPWAPLLCVLPLVAAGGCSQDASTAPKIIAVRAYSEPFRETSERDTAAPPEITVYDDGLTVVDVRASSLDPSDLVASRLDDSQLQGLRSLLDSVAFQPMPAALARDRAAAFAVIYQIAVDANLIELVAYDVDVADAPGHNPFNYRDELLELDAELSRLAELVTNQGAPFEGRLPSVRVVGGPPEG